MRIRFLLLIKVMRISDHWSTDPLRLNFESPSLHYGPLQLLNFGYDADPDTSLQSDADPDPASQSNVDPDPQPSSQSFLIYLRVSRETIGH